MIVEENSLVELCFMKSIPLPFYCRAAKLRPEVSCLWKLLGDACTSVCVISASKVNMKVLGFLVGQKEDKYVLRKGELLSLGGR